MADKAKAAEAKAKGNAEFQALRTRFGHRSKYGGCLRNPFSPQNEAMVETIVCSSLQGISFQGISFQPQYGHEFQLGVGVDCGFPVGFPLKRTRSTKGTLKTFEGVPVSRLVLMGNQKDTHHLVGFSKKDIEIYLGTLSWTFHQSPAHIHEC